MYRAIVRSCLLAGLLSLTDVGLAERTDYDGFGRDASDNNTLYIPAWLAF